MSKFHKYIEGLKYICDKRFGGTNKYSSGEDARINGNVVSKITSLEVRIWVGGAAGDGLVNDNGFQWSPKELAQVFFCRD